MSEQVQESIPEVPSTDPPPQPEVKTYSYQAVDEEGAPLGRPTVIKYTTEAELIAGMETANKMLVRALYTKNLTPEPAPEPKEQTPAELQARLDELDRHKAGSQFVSRHPDYYNVEANGHLITRYLLNNKLDQRSVTNLEIAYVALQREGRLIERPNPTPDPVSPATPPDPAANPAPVATPDAPKPVPGVQPGQFTARPQPKKSLTLADVRAMPPAEYARRCKDPKFVEQINRLGLEAKSKRTPGK